MTTYVCPAPVQPLLRQALEALELSKPLSGHEEKWSAAINAIYAAPAQEAFPPSPEVTVRMLDWAEVSKVKQQCLYNGALLESRLIEAIQREFCSVNSLSIGSAPSEPHTVSVEQLQRPAPAQEAFEQLRLAWATLVNLSADMEIGPLRRQMTERAKAIRVYLNSLEQADGRYAAPMQNAGPQFVPAPLPPGNCGDKDCVVCTPVRLPQPERAELTDAEIDEVHDNAREDLSKSIGFSRAQAMRTDTSTHKSWRYAFARAIEATLKGKNAKS